MCVSLLNASNVVLNTTFNFETKAAYSLPGDTTILQWVIIKT